MGPRCRRCYPEVEGRWGRVSRRGVQVEGPVGPGSPEGDAPVTSSTTRAADQAARLWMVARNRGAESRWPPPWREYPYAHRPQYTDSYYTGERQRRPGDLAAHGHAHRPG